MAIPKHPQAHREQQDTQELVMAVASHKPYWMPTDPCYVPVWVGAAFREGREPQGWMRDDSYPGNISAKNSGYCELCALHWLWRQTASPYAGLVHYRRHFARGPFGSAKKRVASPDVLLARLKRAPLILPAPRHYVIENTYTQYAHAHHPKDLALIREILSERYPYVLPAWDASMRRTTVHRFNMFVARRDVLDAWCSFLFDVLACLEERIDTTGYSEYDQRVYGFLAERLLDPWVEANAVPFTELGVANLENPHWPRKAADFLVRKLKADVSDLEETR